MAKQTQQELIPTTEQTTNNQLLQIEPLIRIIRGQQVLLDSDLAILYGVETKRLNEQVKRNIERFPDDFMFQLTKVELVNLKSQIATSSATNDSLRSQIVTLNTENYSIRSQNATLNAGTNLKSQIVTSSHGGARKLPYAFTENGIAMLSSVLRSPIAIQVNIRIMRAFTAMRQFIASNAQIFQRLDVMEQNQLAIVAHQTETDHKLEEVFRRLDSGNVQPHQGIFYDGQIFDAYTFINDRIREATTRIILIDNYINDSVLTILSKRVDKVAATIYTKKPTAQLQLDIQKHNAQYPPISVIEFDRSHDRFLCIDETVYHLGASIKDLGKKWFAFCRMDMPTTELLHKLPV
ncbi:MAG: ORF6N domain-containing protein [Paludibacteraceae bacterium]|nr:ORF6N domain-containing protein [Paludibacteraceae bacterium]